MEIKVGDRFGMLTAVMELPRSKSGHQQWLFHCDCGKSKPVSVGHVKRHNNRSCGCQNARLRKGKESPSYKHGHRANYTQSPTYNSWACMMERCYNPNNVSYLNYGYIGIEVCKRWHKFENFLADMGERPNGLTLDRIDVKGNYEPGNCRWADKWTQNNNKWHI